MKDSIEQLIRAALEIYARENDLESARDISFKVENTRDQKHGDLACNVAMVLASRTGTKPRELAEKIVSLMPPSALVNKVDIAGPGFINFFLNQDSFLNVIHEIREKGEKFGQSDFGKDQSILIEFVSANPTGPLHIGHGRGAAYGAATANMLEAAGYRVEREYYVNDAGRQMDILAVSVWLRYLQFCDINIELPGNAYQGDYIKDIADAIYQEKKSGLVCSAETLTGIIASHTDPEKLLDALIACAKTELGKDNYLFLFEKSLNAIRDDIENDLAEFGVVFDNWFSEKSLTETNKVEEAIDILRRNDYLYQKDGATWFRSTDLGDEKDRVVIRENGQTTYFASDIAYHHLKYERGYDRMIDIWGADHHGYIARVKASLEALGKNPDLLDILLVQFATLYRGPEKLQMSTRSGQFVTLRELRNEVGKDAARFFYVMRKSEQHLDFDLELAKSESQDNPVYYIQYAHARVCSVLRQASEKNLTLPADPASVDLDRLDQSYEKAILTRLSIFPEILLNAAQSYEPHQIVFYLRELANEFHTYYNACQILVDDEGLRNARIELICAVRQVIRNGLSLLGVSTPEKM